MGISFAGRRPDTGMCHQAAGTACGMALWRGPREGCPVTRSRGGSVRARVGDEEGQHPGHPWVQGEECHRGTDREEAEAKEGAWGGWGRAGAFPNIHARILKHNYEILKNNLTL